MYFHLSAFLHPIHVTANLKWEHNSIQSERHVITFEIRPQISDVKMYAN